jgi:hypothetical protein
MSLATHRTFVVETAKGDAAVVSTDGQNVTLAAPFAAPPGSPIVGRLRGTGHVLRVKVHGCRRIATVDSDGDRSPESKHDVVQPDRFEITGRWVNLSREARLMLLNETELT